MYHIHLFTEHVLARTNRHVVDDVNLNTRNEQYLLVHVGWLMGLSVVGIWVNRSR